MDENEARHDRALRRTTVHPETSTTGRPTKWHALAVLVGSIVPLGMALPGGAVSRPRSFTFLGLSIPFFAAYFRGSPRPLREHF